MGLLLSCWWLSCMVLVRLWWSVWCGWVFVFVLICVRVVS